MRGKLLFITGGLIGYVLGSRAGRKRYDQIAAAAKDLWSAKPVQRRVTEVRDVALEAVGDVPAAIFNAGKKFVAAAQSKKAQATDAASAAMASAKTAAASAKTAASAAAKSATATAEAADAAETRGGNAGLGRDPRTSRRGTRGRGSCD